MPRARHTQSRNTNARSTSEGERARTELVRVPKFTYWQGLAAAAANPGHRPGRRIQRRRQRYESRTAQSAADERRAEWLRYPVTAVRAALIRRLRLTNPRTHEGQSIVEVLTSDGRAFTLAIDAATRLPTRVITAANNVNLGDVPRQHGVCRLPERDGVAASIPPHDEDG